MNFQATPSQAMFMAIIAQLPSSVNTPWSAATEQMYLIGLRSISDDDLPKLCDVVLDSCKFRPTVYEIKDLWRKLTALGDVLTAADLVAGLSERVSKHGANGVPHPTLKYTFLPGPPPDLSKEENAVVATWGGWVQFCEDDSPVGVRRGHLLKIADMVIQGNQGDSIQQHRIEYQEQQAAFAQARRLEVDASE